jgi:hypothetical protein
VIPSIPPASSGDLGYALLVTLHAAPESVRYDPPRDLSGRTLRSLAVTPCELTRPMGVSFEQACQRLGQFARMFCEPDGSFVWRGGGNPSWQVDGVLYDRGNRLLFVELKGKCPAGELDDLLEALGHRETPLVFQLIREGLVLDEGEFRRWAECRLNDAEPAGGGCQAN